MNERWYHGLNAVSIPFVIGMIVLIITIAGVSALYAFYDTHPYQKERLNGQECVVFVDKPTHVECPVR